MPTLAVSSWSLHRDLGPTYPEIDPLEGPRTAAYPYGHGSITLLDLPTVVAALGIHQLEICHFHFPETGATYLRAFRASLAAAQVHPLTVLIDEGDISAEDSTVRRRALDHMRGWLEVAATLGAPQARVAAGLAAPDGDGEAVRRSAEALAALAQHGASLGVRVLTENWRTLAMDPASLLAILERTGDVVGLCVDLGNYTGPGKYDALARLLPRAVTVHAKAEFTRPGMLEHDDFLRCLDLARHARFTGPYVLIFDGVGDEQASLTQMVEVVRPYL